MSRSVISSFQPVSRLARHADCKNPAYAASPRGAAVSPIGRDCKEDSRGAPGTMGAAGAVIMSAKIDGLAAKRAAVVDERLGFLDGHCRYLGGLINSARQDQE